MSVCLSVYWTELHFCCSKNHVCLSGRLCVCLSGSLSMYIPMYVCLCACLSLCLSVCLYVLLCVCRWHHQTLVTLRHQFIVKAATTSSTLTSGGSQVMSVPLRVSLSVSKSVCVSFPHTPGSHFRPYQQCACVLCTFRFSADECLNWKTGHRRVVI